MINRILIIGSGNIARRHQEIARNIFPKSKIIFFSRSLKSDEANGIEVVSDDDGAIQFRPDLTVICCPSTLHLHYASLFMKNGSHILCEKPLSNSLDKKSISIISKLIETTGKVFLLGYNLRFLESLIFFKGQVAGGHIGKILSVSAEVGQYLPDWRPNKPYQDSVTANQDLGGGVLLELSHEIDYLSWIFGNIVWLFANVSKQSNLKISVEDTAHFIFEFSGTQKIPAKIMGVLMMDLTRRDVRRSCMVVGELGSLYWDGVRCVVEYFRGGNKEWEELYKNPKDLSNSYIKEWEYLKYCIDNKVNAIPGLHEGESVLSIIEASRISSSERRPVITQDHKFKY